MEGAGASFTVRSFAGGSLAEGDGMASVGERGREVRQRRREEGRKRAGGEVRGMSAKVERSIDSAANGGGAGIQTAEFRTASCRCVMARGGRD